MIIDNVLYYSLSLFILFANLLAKAVPMLVYLYIIVYFFDKKVKINFFLLEGGDLSSKPKAECPLLV